ncbi:MAG TPA: hypothetical protein VIK91_15375 [Nannocystis sp.]
MIRPQSWISAALALVIVPACGDDGQAATSAASGALSSTGETAATTDAATGDEPTTSGGTDSTGSGTTGEPMQFEPMPALGGLEIDWVEANQGVGVAIGRDGKGIGGDARTSYLLQNRVTLIRAFWKELPEDWVPRPIEARLIVSGYPEGEKVLKNVTQVEGASFVGNLNKSFYWGLMAHEVIPGLKYRIELYETEEGYAMLAPDTQPGPTPPRMPLEGDAWIGIENSYQVMKVTIVPFSYNFGGCTTTPDTSEKTIKAFTDYMFMMNPLERIEVTVHDTIAWQGQLTHFGQLNSFMVDLRQQDGAPPEMYYYGLVDVCSGGLGGAGGQAIDIPNGAKKSDAWKRISSGLWLPKNQEWSFETFVHEVGHSQGRYHIACDGEAGTDNTYPHPGGNIGEWGFSVVNYKLYHPTVHKDYMTYCHPVWASTFGWNKTYPVIRELSSWDMEGGKVEPELKPTLLGMIYPDGSEYWTTVMSDVDTDNLSAVHKLEFYAGGDQLAVFPVEVRPQPDSDAFNIVAPLPDDFDDVVTHFVRDDGKTRTTVPASALTRRPRDLKSR